MKQKFSLRKKIISGLYFLIALLMLSLFFGRERWWQIAVFVLSALIAFIIYRLYRCPACNARIPSDFTGTCKECGTELEDIKTHKD